MNFARTASRQLFYLPTSLSASSNAQVARSGIVRMSTSDEAALNITADSKCAGCSSFSEPMKPEEVQLQRSLLIPDWNANDECTQLKKSLKLKNFAAALDYVNKIGQIAESENHHPDLTIRSYNHVDITLWTHAIRGLTSNDFIVAVKIDTIPVVLSKSKKSAH